MLFLSNMLRQKYAARIVYTLLLMTVHLTGFGQYARNFANSNYGGLQSISYNPANLADSRYRFVLTPFSVFADINNNFINVKTPYSIYNVLNDNVATDLVDENGIAVWDNSFMQDRLNGNKKQAYVSAEVMGPSFLLGRQDKSGIAFTMKTRFFAQVDGLDENLMKAFLVDFDTTASDYSVKSHQNRLMNKPGTQSNMGLGALAYQEFAFSYGAVLSDKKENFFKGGVTLKYLIGLASGYARVDDLSYELVGIDSIRFRTATISSAYTSDQYFTTDRRLNDYLGKNKLGKGMGIDIGVVYEYRPNYKNFSYRMDKRKHEDRTVNKYKFKIGGAITDFGSIKFNNQPFTQQVTFLADGDSVDWADFEEVTRFNGTNDIDSFAIGLFPSTTVDSSFSSKLPASFNINFDLNLENNWYLSASYVQSIRGKKVKGVRKQSVAAVGARYETRRFEASSSLVFGHFYNPILLSAFVRYGPVYIGSDNLGGIFGGKSTNGYNIFAGVQFPILHNLIPDEDGDGTSDAKDKCLGVFGSEYAKGCPDKDDDRVPDIDDKCPDVPGAKNAKGCPDEDGDGIGGSDDHCPTIAGTKANHGCPDTDGDGIADDVDACIDVYGEKKYNGCPDQPEPKDTAVVPVVMTDTSHRHTDPEPAKVKPKPIPPGKDLTVDDIVDLMDFTTYDYYLILGAYKNKLLADELVKKLNRQAGVLTYIYFDVASQMNYVTFGRVTSKERARQQLSKLKKPSVDALINGHVWWKKVLK
ncbi:MAG: hypothetical protein ACI9JN_002165 [Bacteroidia bacterium]